MSKKECKTSKKESPPSVEEMKQRVRAKCEDIIDYCIQGEISKSFFSIEKILKCHIGEWACLIFQLFLRSFEEKLDDKTW